MADEKMADKQRSSAYPAATIEDCLEVLNAIKGLGGRTCSAQAVADKMGASTTTNSFKAKISSSKQYGFIENIKSVIQLTERGRALIYPTSNDVERNILLECFQSPPLYVKLVQSYLGKALPAVDKLANELIKPLYGITTAAKDLAAECFKKNAEYVGALQNGILTFDIDFSSDKKISDSETESISENEEDLTTVRQESISTSAPTKKQQLEGYRFQIPMLSGATAEIFLPNNIKPIDLEFFEQSVNCMLPLFIKNLKATLMEDE